MVYTHYKKNQFASVLRFVVSKNRYFFAKQNYRFIFLYTSSPGVIFYGIAEIFNNV